MYFDAFVVAGTFISVCMCRKGNVPALEGAFCCSCNRNAHGNIGIGRAGEVGKHRKICCKCVLITTGIHVSVLITTGIHVSVLITTGIHVSVLITTGIHVTLMTGIVAHMSRSGKIHTSQGRYLARVHTSQGRYLARAHTSQGRYLARVYQRVGKARRRFWRTFLSYQNVAICVS